MSTSTKSLTKAQLVTELAALRESYQRLEQRLADEQARNAPRPARPAPQPQAAAPSGLSFRERCARARAEAMATGRCVRVPS